MKLGVIGGIGLYVAGNSLYNVELEGGQRAIVFNRLWCQRQGHLYNCFKYYNWKVLLIILSSPKFILSYLFS